MSLEQPACGKMHPDDAELAARLRELPPMHDRKRFNAALLRLADEAAARGRGAAVFHELEMSPSAGHRIALEFLIRLPDPLPLVLTAAAVPVLKEEAIPLSLRMAVAGKLLTAVPDDPQTVYPVVQALTLGTSRIKRLERLLHLQRMVDRCATLDVIVEEAERKAQLDCPRCDQRLPRGKLIAHLWAVHGLMYHERLAVPPRALLDVLISKAAAEKTPERIAEAFAAARTFEPLASNRLVFQALCARGIPEVGEVEQLLDLAYDDHGGLCPVCLQAVPSPLPPLPPPANLACGRLSAEGYEARVADSPSRRDIGFERVVGEAEAVPVPLRLSPRAAATWPAVGVLMVTVVLLIVLPARLAVPRSIAAAGLMVAFLVYLCRRFTKAKWPDADETALTVAWVELTPGLGRSERAVRFLMRLTRLSLTRGDPSARSAPVHDLAEKMRTLADRSPQTMQLAAAADLLFIFDRIRLGLAKLHDAALLFGNVFDGSRDWVYGETLAELILADADLRNGDERRLGVQILGLAFNAEWSPRDIADAARFLPHVGRLCVGNDPEYLARLWDAHRERDRGYWDRLGGAIPMTSYAQQRPDEARRILAVHPDATLKLHDQDGVAEELGPAVLTLRGLAVGPVLLADAAVPMSCVAVEPGLFRVTLGSNRIPCRRAIPESFFAALRAWARFAVKPAVAVVIPSSSIADAQLTKLAVACPLCKFEAIPEPGRVGTPLQGLFGDERSFKV